MTNYEFGICTMDINGVYPEDSGVITCRATNASGTIESSGQLYAIGRYLTDDLGEEERWGRFKYNGL